MQKLIYPPAFPSVYPLEVPDKCVLYYDIQEYGAVAKLIDHSGYGNHGTLVGTTQDYAPVGLAKKFNGSSDYIDCGNAVSLQSWTQFSIDIWANIPASDATVRMLASKCSGTGNTSTDGWYFCQYLDGTNTKLIFRVYKATRDKEQIISNTIVPGWHHVVAVYNQVNVSIYVDGVLSGTPSAITTHSPANSNNLVIGKVANASSNYFKGTMGLAKIFNKALNITEIKSFYNQDCQRFGLRII